ncbi:MAG: HAD family hydrolase [Candidatus Hodarchaeales archaeon]|jgi:putative hydrolase of the HAD superfamily
MILSVVFDIDGTLFDHLLAQERALDSLYSSMKQKIPNSNLKEFLTTWKTRTDHYFDEYLAGRITFKKQRILRVKSVFLEWGWRLSAEKAWEIFKQYLVKYQQNWTLYKDVLPCLTMLKDLPLGVISNGDGKQQRKKLAEINSFFSSIVISDEIGFRKPHPEIFKRSSKELNLSLKDILYVGDQLETDVLGALNSGMRSVWINRTYQNHVNSDIDLEVPTISKLTELPIIVKQLQE